MFCQAEVHTDALTSAIAKGNPGHALTSQLLSLAARQEAIRVKFGGVFPHFGVMMEAINIKHHSCALWNENASKFCVLSSISSNNTYSRPVDTQIL